MTEIIEREFRRCRTLLSTSGERLQEIPPEPSPDSIGALAGLGFEVKDPDVKFNVYVFERQNQHPAAIEKLIAEMSIEGIETLYSSNGSLLFFGYTHIDGSHGIKAKFRLGNLASAFAGEE